MKLKWIITPVFALFSCNLFCQNEKLTEAFSKSYVAESNKKYNEAVAALESAGIADVYEVQLRLGWLQYLAGNYVKSASHYRKAIEFKPKSVEAKLGLAYPLFAMGNMDELVKNYQDILQTDPGNYIVNSRLTALYTERKQYEMAQVHAQKLIDLYPFDYSANLAAAKVFVGLGKIVEAKKCYQVCLLLSPNDPEALAAIKKL